jgi:hypothetical protein
MKGGLGNQMFQYAAGKKLSLIHNCKLKLATNWYKDSNDRTFDLGQYKIPGTVIIGSSRQIFNFYRKTVKEEEVKNQPEIFFTIDNGSILDGYWQNPDYFKDIESELRDEFKLKVHKTFFTDLDDKVRVSIHVRRGDYLQNKNLAIHGVLPKNYYSEAISIIERSTKIDEIIIFSDDIKWAKENLIFSYKTVFSDSFSNSAAEDMILMSKCKHNILANSTFSWWATWLNNNKNKIVIAPKKWFVSDKLVAPNFYQTGWIKI